MSPLSEPHAYHTSADREAHWQRIYTEKDARQVSWYRPHLDQSLALIGRIAADRETSVIDIGGGASTLAADLLACGYRNLTVLDISAAAIDLARGETGEAAHRIQWLAADVLTADLRANAYDLWHDRAVFHFLTAAEERTAYVSQLIRVLRPGGHAVISIFGPEGPQKCSGLDVVRYDAAGLARELGPRFRLNDSFPDLHQTPSGATQQVLCCHFSLKP